MNIGYDMTDVRKAVKKGLYELTLKKDKVEEFGRAMTKYGLTIGYAIGIVEQNIVLETLPDTLVLLIMNEMYKLLHLPSLNVEIYFTKSEIETAKQFRFKKDDGIIDFPIIIEDVERISNDMYMAVVDSDFLVSLNRSGMINYNFKTQREAKEIVLKDGIIQAPTVNWQSVDEIKEHLLRGTFFSNMLTFNLPIDGSDLLFGYDEQNQTLTIRSGRFDIIDGYHRLLGIINASKIIDLDYKFLIRIVNYTTNKANQLIVQEDKRNAIDKTHIKKINATDFVANVVNSLNTDSDSVLFGKIAKDSKTINLGYSLYRFDVVYETIKFLWGNDLKHNRDVVKLTSNIVKSLDIIDMKIPAFETEQSNKAFKGYNDERLFPVYMSIIKESNFDEEKIDMMIEQLVNNFDLLTIPIKEVQTYKIYQNAEKFFNDHIYEILEVISSVL